MQSEFVNFTLLLLASLMRRLFGGCQVAATAAAGRGQMQGQRMITDRNRPQSNHQQSSAGRYTSRQQQQQSHRPARPSQGLNKRRSRSRRLRQSHTLNSDGQVTARDYGRGHAQPGSHDPLMGSELRRGGDTGQMQPLHRQQQELRQELLSLEDLRVGPEPASFPLGGQYRGRGHSSIGAHTQVSLFPAAS